MIEIRLAIEADLDAIEDLMMQVGKETEAAIFCADTAEYIGQHISNEGFILLAEAKRALAGFVMVRYPGEATDNLGFDLHLSQPHRAQVAHMESLAVASAFRGLGLQRRMIEAAQCAIDADHPLWLATVAPDNLPSLHNFLRLGYTVVATVEKYGGHKRHILYRRKR